MSKKKLLSNENSVKDFDERQVEKPFLSSQFNLISSSFQNQMGSYQRLVATLVPDEKSSNVLNASNIIPGNQEQLSASGFEPT